jgi:NAD(P)-dependent dehydrogenase (short-subunit alcohol dehydrogenase family)
MAKAALNMMTRTAGSHYAKSNIFMTSVDTGWVTDEVPLIKRNDENFICPLDEIDGAMRVLDPIYEGYRNIDNQ